MNLENWISKENDSEELLPLCHTTKFKYFQQIIRDKKLTTSFSKFPDPNPTNQSTENLVYLFYGLPFYIYEIGDGDKINSEAIDELPIGLIFKQDLVHSVDKFYPFDTGALLSNLYKDIFDINIDNDLKIYEVKINDGSETKKLVRRYYKCNEKYCFGIFNKDILSNSQNEKKLINLLGNDNTSKVDLRIRAIEVHSLNDINLSENLLAVVLPRIRSREDKSLEKNIKSISERIDIIYYNDLTRFNSETVRTSMMNAAIDYYNNKYPDMFSLDRLTRGV